MNVTDFEREFGWYVGAQFAVACCNGTATLHTALAALDVGPGSEVAVPPLTMSATTIAVLHAGARPVFVDVDPETWLMRPSELLSMPVSLYGVWSTGGAIDDAAQTLRQHDDRRKFTSYSFQASKILALGEGGMLVTNDEELAVRAREFASLGYRMRANQARIAKDVLKSPSFERHHRLGWNYRMADAVADRAGYRAIWQALRRGRSDCASLYRDAIDGCSWIKAQRIPDGGAHDYWAYAVALDAAELWHPFAEAVERYGGTRPFAAWRLTYQEPAFRHLAEDGTCPVAESLQPRIVAGQTNDYESANRNAEAWYRARMELNGGRH